MSLCVFVCMSLSSGAQSLFMDANQLARQHVLALLVKQFKTSKNVTVVGQRH